MVPAAAQRQKSIPLTLLAIPKSSAAPSGHKPLFGL
jgi:hypothetical protein